MRRALTDSGRRAEELLVDKHSLKYNFGFPSSNGPTPEILKNYLDVRLSLQITDLWTFKSSLSTGKLKAKLGESHNNGSLVL